MTQEQQDKLDALCQAFRLLKLSATEDEIIRAAEGFRRRR
jgi:hypothetical protein